MYKPKWIVTPEIRKAESKEIEERMGESARDFQTIVWPKVSKLPLVNGGELQPVEAVADRDFADKLDLIAGIDAWQILPSPSAAVRGLASRVQWNAKRTDTFTIGTRQSRGGESEFAKRVRAIANADEGHLYPHLTIHAYLNCKQGDLLAAAVVKTRSLFEIATKLKPDADQESGKPAGARNNDFGIRRNGDSLFFFVSWDYLIKNDIAVDRL